MKNRALELEGRGQAVQVRQQVQVCGLVTLSVLGCAAVAGAAGALERGRCKERDVGPHPEGPCVLSQELEFYPESHGYP